MASLKPITIIGGGLGGLTLGIGLRQRDVPVTVWEAGRYPRHRVCGEFVSGRGQEVLEQLGLLTRFERAGAVRAQTVMFVVGSRPSAIHRLPQPAICLSRYSMDTLLATEFQRCGGEIREGADWSGGNDEGVVCASGRRLQPDRNRRQWFGMKVHARNVELEADLEMHVSSAGYVGVNRLSHGEVNVCGLFRSHPGGSLPGSKLDWLRGPCGSGLRARLADAVFDGTTFCSVAGLSLNPCRASAQDQCCIGDALTLIPPVTGNGMSMAFESAQIAIEPIAAFSRGELNWEQARRAVAHACDTTFARRLAWARLLQWLMLSPLARSRAGAVLLRSEWFWQLMFARTR